MQQRSDSNKWLRAQLEHNTALNTLPSCVKMCDLNNDNYYQLIAVEIPTDYSLKPKLRVYKGTTLIAEHGISGIPSAIECLYSEEHELTIPTVAVSVGPSVLFYRNMKPYYKYTLPSASIETLETEVWRKLSIGRNGRLEEIENLIASLRELDIACLTPVSQKLLNIPVEQREEFINDFAEEPLHKPSIVVAMTALKRSSQDTKSVSCLIIAVEPGEIFILDSHAFTVLYNARLSNSNATPSLISASGLYDIDFRIVVSTREGSIWILRKSTDIGQEIIQLEHPVNGLKLLPTEQTIIVVCTNSMLLCYSQKGKKLWDIQMSKIVCMEPIELTHLSKTLIAVSLRGGLIQIYSQKMLVDQFTMQDTVSVMKFGRLGNEEYVLVLVTTDGSLTIKILKRKADFDNPIVAQECETSAPNAVPNAVNSILQIPKKTKAFIDNMVRDRVNACSIYQSFQTDLWRLRLLAAKTTVEVVNSAETAISGDIGHVPIKISTQVFGQGNMFRMSINIENLAGQGDATGLNVLLHFDNRLYSILRPYTKLPTIKPKAPIKIDFLVTAIMAADTGHFPNDASASASDEQQTVRVVIMKNGQVKPLIASRVSMPAAELPVLDF